MRALALTALVLLAVPAQAQQSGAPALPPLLDDSVELWLARSAAPRELSDSADLYVLRRGGHERVHAGTNGAACLVSRDHPESLYPICYDPEAARTILPIQLERQRLREQGVEDAAIDSAIERGVREGRFRLPSRMAVAYMMSGHQVIYAGAKGPRVGAWFPHLMLYSPYATRRDLAVGGLPNGDLSLSDAGLATAHWVVMTRDWATPPSAAAPAPLQLSPGWLCSGDEYEIRWQGSTAPDRAVRYPESGGDTLGSAFTPALRGRAQQSTVLELYRGSELLVRDTVTVHGDSLQHNWVRPTAACSGRLSVASMGIAPERGSDRIRPRVVRNQGAHAVTITHRGRSVRVEPGGETAAFNDLPFTGDWGVVVDTGASNEFCPAPAGAPPTGPPVHVVIVTRCY